jgi:hypothetical protein
VAKAEVSEAGILKPKRSKPKIPKPEKIKPEIFKPEMWKIESKKAEERDLSSVSFSRRASVVDCASRESFATVCLLFEAWPNDGKGKLEL